MLIAIIIVVSLFIFGWLINRNEVKKFMTALDEIEKIFGDNLNDIQYYMGLDLKLIASKDDNRVYFKITNNLAISIKIKDKDFEFEEYTKFNLEQKQKIEDFKHKFGFPVLKSVLPRPYFKF